MLSPSEWRTANLQDADTNFSPATSPALQSVAYIVLNQFWVRLSDHTSGTWVTHFMGVNFIQSILRAPLVCWRQVSQLRHSPHSPLSLDGPNWPNSSLILKGSRVTCSASSADSDKSSPRTVLVIIQQKRPQGNLAPGIEPADVRNWKEIYQIFNGYCMLQVPIMKFKSLYTCNT